MMWYREVGNGHALRGHSPKRPAKPVSRGCPMKTYLYTALFTLVAATTALPASAEVGLGADVVSRYVWRGADFGDAVSVQPYISYGAGPLEIGTWASYPISSAAGANEHDLYVTYSVQDLAITVTDYYFPQGGQFLEFGNGDGAHLLEVSASYAVGSVSLLGAFNFWNDDDDSYYAEVAYALPELSEGVEAGVFAGMGNGVYSSDDDPKLVNVGLTVANDEYSASYVLNPDTETTYLVFGLSF